MMACFAHVGGLASPAASHPHPTCSGPREPGVAAASTARRGRFDHPRRALAPRLPPPHELGGACGRVACAHRGSECAPPPLERQRSRACPPLESAGVRAGVRSAADAMIDAMGKAVYDAASANDVTELKRQIGLGGSVNWHRPGVRRRMRLA